MNRRERQQIATQRIIVETARELFFENGVEETTMEQIAQAADYTRRTLYAYFQSREEVCLLVFLEGLRARWERQRRAMEAAATGLEKIRGWGEALAAFSLEHPHDLRLQAYWDYKGIDRSRIRPEIFSEFEGLNEEIVQGLRDAFTLGEQDGSVRPGLPVDLTIGQYAHTLRAVLNKTLFPGYTFAPAEPETSFRHFLDLFVRSIANRPDDLPGSRAKEA